ncbi:MAG TPA: T9SS type A sorting domain-containing protein [Flavobacteriaceae bacterium]|nr:T9SS type A sorting domain-containing protein [Flavobacteriaceae bacterium]
MRLPLLSTTYFKHLFILAVSVQLFAQDMGQLDTSFNTLGIEFAGDAGFNGGWPHQFIEQPDGKILVAGSMTETHWHKTYGVSRINPDGSYDASFEVSNKIKAPSSSTPEIYSMALQPDGKIVMTGTFNLYESTSRIRIMRLNSDGSLDTSFNPGTSANFTIKKVVMQNDGKFLIGGSFTSYNGNSINRIARLNPDGSFDATFLVGTGFNSNVNDILIQDDGKIIIVGDFTQFNGNSHVGAVRLNTDGSLDTTFIPDPVSSVLCVAKQSDGKLLLGGWFEQSSGSNRNYLIRLHPNGSLDTSFVTSTGPNTYVNKIQPLTSGKILFSGGFISYQGNASKYLARINSDGSFDATFNQNTGFDDFVTAIYQLDNGNYLIGGEFETYNSAMRVHALQLNENGSLDTNFNEGKGTAKLNATNSSEVYSISSYDDGRILLAGNFSHYNCMPYNRIVRTHADGSIDGTFQPGTGANNIILATEILPDGKIIIAGTFTNYNGMNINRIARLNPDGSLDTSFNVGTGSNGKVDALAIQNDGKILVGGLFTDFNGLQRYCITRLNTDGSNDTTFNNGNTGAYDDINRIKILADGKIMLFGKFRFYNEVAYNRVMRLNPDGTPDNTFNTAGTGIDGTSTFFEIRDADIQPDGKIVMYGNFNSYNGTANNALIRINSDGSLDSSFQMTEINTPQFFSKVKILSDGNILVSGILFTSDPTNNNKMIELFSPVGERIHEFNENETGISVHPDSIYTTPSPQGIYALDIQPDGKILMGGAFHFYNETLTSNVARLHYDNSTLGINNLDSRTVKFYPNPTTDYVHFSETVSELTIYTISMQKVQVAKNTHIVNLSKLPTGIYIFKGKDKNEKPFAIKVIKGTR